MGKNQAYKAMQRARVGSSHAAPDDVDDGMVDGSFHTPEWHAARLASLNTSHTVTWEEFKRKQKDEALKRGELEADKDRMMREYRAQLDAERERKLAQGRNHSSSKSKHKKDKDKTSRRHSSKKRKWSELFLNYEVPKYVNTWLKYQAWPVSRSSKNQRNLLITDHHIQHSRRRSPYSSSSSSSSESSSSDDEERESRSKSRSKKSRKERKHRSRSKNSSSDSEKADGPLPLSRFFGNVKS